MPVLAVACGLMVLNQLGRNIHDVDIFWQLKLGERTLADGLPKHEPFLAGKEAEPLAVVAWLSQCGYAAVRSLGGWRLLWAVDAVVWFGGFAVVAVAERRRLANDWPVVLALFLGWFTAVPCASLRPQSFAALAFGLLLVLLRSNLSTARTAIWGSVLFVAWQNLHPSVMVGAGAIGAAAVAAWVQFWRNVRPGPPWRVTLLLPLAAVATVATPAGFDVFRISALNAEMSRYLEVAEWQPLTWRPFEFGRPTAWAAVLVTAVGLYYRGRHARAETLAVVGLMTVAMLVSHRFMLFWGIAIVPLWCEMVGTLMPTAEAEPNRFRPALGVLVVLSAVGFPVAMRPVPFADHYPFAGIDALRATGRKGVVYTSFFWGGVVIDGGHPDWRVSHDGRYYLFTKAEWDRYFTAARGDVPLDELLKQYHPCAFFLQPDSDEGIIRPLLARPDWKLIHRDANCAVFVPRDTAGEASR